MLIDSLSGVITWLPITGQIGTHSVEVHVVDGVGGTAIQTFSVVVNDGVSNLPPTITSIAPQFVVEGTLFSYQVEASDPDGDVLTTNLLLAPAGTTLSGNTINWTPDLGQTIPRYADFSVQVTDGLNTATSPSGSLASTW